MNAQERASKARYILEDEAVREAFSAIEADCISRWRTSGAEDFEDRENAYATLVGLDLFRNQLASFISDGRIAETRKNRQED